jgi:hypothetical protein
MTLTLAELGKRYFAKVDAYNASDLETDEEAEKMWAIQRRMLGVPVCSDEDALAAVDWLINLGDGSTIELAEEDERDAMESYRIAGSLMRELRAYLARKVQT